ncbi:MAG: arginine-tRNA-protein transferase [Cyclobacteriaceae bacterium]|nr:arginyl-tRNA--protein transferase [Flammeovirgaceae bacterium]
MEPYFEIRYPASLAGRELDQLLALGWFRMHQAIFTKSHLQREGLLRVHWLRYEVAAVQSRPSHNRIWKRNRHFRVTIERVNHIGAEHEQLYARYRNTINFDGATGVAQWLWDDEPSGRSIYQTYCISVYDSGHLIAAGYFDTGETSAASILHFYDPQYERYSPGKWLILLTLDFLRKHHFRYYYPGYVVEGDRKMNYKLFLGAEQARYFDPGDLLWKPIQQLPEFETHFV